MSRKKTFKDLTAEQKKGLGILSAVQFLLAGAALVDIWRRPRTEIRGSRAAWSAACAVNFVGPLSYFVFGRRRS
ncbi:PLDc_N domain-containing protein [Arthrobacter sp. Sa2CUA1]|uniref:PLDc_N domain-containing protein n=1 Tax=Arthrobacter gallicola TaxID=2762225 RepID=A0ABR8US27_9MICC|nr:PLD nuclease N-terminal domain-containing protein [Arthrobacter gallicola]MBD7994906.1 PLDc_N domain-containing protein [Arthrobacter gallicola]